MEPIINQLTPFTCALDCWAHFMREQGLQISTEDILKNHRDICYSPQNHAQFGAMELQNFHLLIRRYLKQSTVFIPTTIAEIDNKIKTGSGIFISALTYPNGCGGTVQHMLRAVGVNGNKVEILTPAFPYGFSENASLDKGHFEQWPF
jgi:hypothetical protein